MTEIWFEAAMKSERLHRLVAGLLSKGSLTIILVSVVFSFCIFSASRVEITYDEAWSWSAVRRSTLPGILTYSEFTFANNHLLNSLWLAASNQLYPDNLMLMRLPSLLSLPAYIAAIYFLLRRSNLAGLSFLIISAAILHPMVLKHFYLARGYSLALTTEVLSLYWAIAFLKRSHRRDLFLSYTFGLLSALSILSFIYFLASLVTVLLFSQIWLYRQEIRQLKFFPLLRRGVFVPELCLLLFTVLYLFPVSNRVANYDPYIPGASSFISGSYASMLSDIVPYFYPSLVRVMLKSLVTAGLTTAIVASLYCIWKKPRGLDERILVIGSVIILEIVFMHVLNLAMNTPYPMGRTAIFLVIQMIIYCGLIADTFLPRAWYPVLVVFLILVTANSLVLDVKAAAEGELCLFCDGPREAVAAMCDEFPEYERDIHVYKDDGNAALNYYRHTQRCSRLQISESNELPKDLGNLRQFDFLYLSATNFTVIQSSGRCSEFERVSSFRGRGKVLLRNLYFPPLMLSSCVKPLQ
jgi:hypothetical protein